ncbi:OmpA family protein [Hahella sp. HN01]|uniref:OmpA family protein n=1 Tax=Hahella sp. HN01 TaxID=2847262 RepID=UPI001C1F0C5A|nr:OmpA family protein [Hahella sp. HN01]MBU6951308.1 OmpA family protein [Hahella sp. HN01]
MKGVDAYLAAVITAVTLTGCASQTALTEQAAYQQYPALEELRDQVEQGKSQNLNVLSPQRYSQARKSYQDALKWAQADNAKATGIARQGLASISEARTNADVAAYNLEDVLNARQKALAANADKVIPGEFMKAEDNLVKLTGMIEKGSVEDAKAGRAEVARQYSQAELNALKGNIVDRARDALESARSRDIDDLAPKTMEMAQEEYQLALKTLDADRTDTERAQTHAQKSLWNVMRAEYIADTVKYFDESDFNEEDKVLWYQQQLATASRPINQQLPFDQPNKEVVRQVSANIQGLMTDRDSALLALENAKTREMRAASEKDELMAQQQREDQRKQAITAKFAVVQSLFTEKEADVYRQKDNVLIRAHGFNFPSGKSEIQGENFALVNKIIEAVKEFPNARVVVSGHTDNRGSTELNQGLSQQRAEEVAKMLKEIGRIPSNKITAMGYGEQRPVSTNDTTEGRADNRRVEVLIVNEGGVEQVY